MSDCPRLGKLYGACEFRPRYDREPPSAEVIKAIQGDLAAPLTCDLETVVRRTYVCDVCIRCGKIVVRV